MRNYEEQGTMSINDVRDMFTEHCDDLQTIIGNVHYDESILEMTGDGSVPYETYLAYEQGCKALSNALKEFKKIKVTLKR